MTRYSSRMSVVEVRGRDPLTVRVARVVKMLCRRFDVPQRRVGLALGISQPNVSARFAGRTPFGVDELETIAGMFSLPTWRILALADEDDQWGSYTTRDLNPEPAGSASALVIALPIRLAVAA